MNLSEENALAEVINGNGQSPQKFSFELDPILETNSENTLRRQTEQIDDCFQRSPSPAISLSSSSSSISFKSSINTGILRSPSPNFSRSPSPNYLRSPSPNFIRSPSPHFSCSPSPNFSPPQTDNNLQSLTNNNLRSPTHNNDLRSPTHNNDLRSPTHNNDLRSPTHNNDLRSPTHNNDLRSPTHNNGLCSPTHNSLPPSPSFSPQPSTCDIQHSLYSNEAICSSKSPSHNAAVHTNVPSAACTSTLETSSVHSPWKRTTCEYEAPLSPIRNPSSKKKLKIVSSLLLRKRNSNSLAKFSSSSDSDSCSSDVQTSNLTKQNIMSQKRFYKIKSSRPHKKLEKTRKKQKRSSSSSSSSLSSQVLDDESHTERLKKLYASNRSDSSTSHVSSSINSFESSTSTNAADNPPIMPKSLNFATNKVVLSNSDTPPISSSESLSVIPLTRDTVPNYPPSCSLSSTLDINKKKITPVSLTSESKSLDEPCTSTYVELVNKGLKIEIKNEDTFDGDGQCTASTSLTALRRKSPPKYSDVVGISCLAPETRRQISVSPSPGTSGLNSSKEIHSYASQTVDPLSGTFGEVWKKRKIMGCKTIPTTESKDPEVLEVFDVIDTSPSVVDLTCEDDDEVEIVSSDQPVVFLGTEASMRRKRKRSRKNLNSNNEPIIIGGDSTSSTVTGAVTTLGNSPSSAILIADSHHSSAVNSNEISTLSEERPLDLRSSIRLRNPELFGDLLDQSVIPIDNETSSRHAEPSLVRPRPLNARSDNSLLRELLLPHGSTFTNTTEPAIPPDVLDDIFSMYADNENSRFRHPLGLFDLAASSRAGLLEGVMQQKNSSLLSYSTKVNIPGQRPVNSLEVAGPSNAGSSTLGSVARSSRTGGTSATKSTRNSSRKVSERSDRDNSSEDSESLACPICFESFQDIKKAGRSLSSTVCGHIFCTDCLEASMKQARKLCPTCRRKLNKKQYHPLYI